ncbi:MAG: putative toxin-antitoxin system toxin component, PIN family [Saprospiraceae bacterium]|nr:putative toxin-antitoxin system toxin component, PIN family [Saprospiraceae bacterium]
MKVLIDTNCLLVAIPRKSPYRWLYDAMKQGLFTLAFTNEILAEYEEQIGVFYSPSVAENVLKTLVNIPKLEKVEVYFKWNLITVDFDDNKFVDCAIACNADYIITHDKHFRILTQIDFPKVNCITINEFKEALYPSS